MNTLSEESSPGMIFVRTPVSAPLVRTSSGEAESFVVGSVGSSVMVAPRASLECMPYPAPTKNSVLLKGPTTAVNFGLPIPALTAPELLASKIELTRAW